LRTVAAALGAAAALLIAVLRGLTLLDLVAAVLTADFFTALGLALAGAATLATLAAGLALVAVVFLAAAFFGLSLMG
jgi:hypothetical protein